MNAVANYRRWFDYEKDAHGKVMASLATVPEANRAGPEFQRAVSILGHMVAARRVWLYRFGAIAEPPKEFFPQSLTIADITTQVGEMHQLWDEYFFRLDEAGLNKTFEYQSYDAGRFRNTIADILTQLFGHSWYHRGQIAMLIRQAGGAPAITDLVYWCREAVPKA